MTRKARRATLYDKVKACLYQHDTVTKESLAYRFNVEASEVAVVLQQLNRDGFVSQPAHPRCPDHLNHKAKCWHPDVYTSLVYRIADK